jgi:two-component system, NarL family, nitrate/nitrite response regulator NarL
MADAEGTRPMLSHEKRGAELTREERDVLSVSARGLISDEVATTLQQPPETTRRLLRSAIQKLGAQSKLEAVVLASRLGLIDPS